MRPIIGTGCAFCKFKGGRAYDPCESVKCERSLAELLALPRIVPIPESCKLERFQRDTNPVADFAHGRKDEGTDARKSDLSSVTVA